MYTTLDLGMQQSAWDAMTSTLPDPDDPGEVTGVRGREEQLDELFFVLKTLLS